MKRVKRERKMKNRKFKEKLILVIALIAAVASLITGIYYITDIIKPAKTGKIQRKNQSFYRGYTPVTKYFSFRNN